MHAVANCWPVDVQQVVHGVASSARTGGKGLFLIYLGFANGKQAGGVQIIEDGEGKRLYTDGEVRNFKLAWISPTQKLYVLSRFPDDALSLDARAPDELV